jgi:hypothetical protein
VEQVVGAGQGVVGLVPVDRAEVTIVVDNFVDLLMAGTDGVRSTSSATSVVGIS